MSEPLEVMQLQVNLSLPTRLSLIVFCPSLNALGGLPLRYTTGAAIFSALKGPAAIRPLTSKRVIKV